MKKGDTFPQCPGEELCRRSPGLPLFVDPQSTPAEACGDCVRRLTKPGFYQHVTLEEVQHKARRILRLDRLRRSGGYPFELQPWEWDGIEALTLARDLHSPEGEPNTSPAVHTKPVQDMEYQRKKIAEIKRQHGKG